MERVYGRDITAAHVGRIDQLGLEWVWVSDMPLIPGGATVMRTDEHGCMTLCDYGPDDTEWLRDAMPHLPRWQQVAVQAAREVTDAELNAFGHAYRFDHALGDTSA